MRLVIGVVGFWLLMGCGGTRELSLPPTDRFYFPLGLLHLDVAGSTEGVLFVSNSNFDRGYDLGSVLAVDLASVGNADVALPKFPSQNQPEGPVSIETLNTSTQQSLFVGPFTGEIAAYAQPNGDTRLFLPSRGEGVPLHVLEFKPSNLTLGCLGETEDVRNCLPSSISLNRNATSETGVPRAPSAYGVAVAQDRGEVLVTHLKAADSPTGTNKNLNSYLVRLSANEGAVDDSDFVAIGSAPANSVAIGKRYAFLTGRYFESGGPILRAVDLDDNNRVISPALEKSFSVLESRGVALSKDESRLYIAARNPDMLIVIHVEGAATREVKFRVVRGISLPSGANDVKIISRAEGHGDLVVISCTSSNMLMFYDDATGSVVARISDLGSQPSSIAIDARENGARIFVSTFEDGRVAVVDVADSLKPEPQLVAYLGKSQACLLDLKNCGGSGQ